jgi:DNA-binding MarR family transcriptional regulator
MEDRPEDVAVRVLDLVMALSDLVERDMVGGLRSLGLTKARAHLVHLLGAGGPSTQRDLAEALGVTPRNVTGLVDALVAGGLVERAPHPTDRRATLVTLTAEGSALAAGMREGQATYAEQLLGDFAVGRLRRLEGDLEELVDTMRSLVDEREQS